MPDAVRGGSGEGWGYSPSTNFLRRTGDDGLPTFKRYSGTDIIKQNKIKFSARTPSPLTPSQLTDPLLYVNVKMRRSIQIQSRVFTAQSSVTTSSSSSVLQQQQQHTSLPSQSMSQWRDELTTASNSNIQSTSTSMDSAKHTGRVVHRRAGRHFLSTHHITAPAKMPPDSSSSSSSSTAVAGPLWPRSPRSILQSSGRPAGTTIPARMHIGSHCRENSIISAVAWLQIRPELCKRCLQASKIHFCIHKM